MCPQVPGHYPLAEWGLLSDSDVEAMYPILERSLGVLMFKMLEQFRDPADYRALLAVMFPDNGVQPSVHNLHSVTHDILQRPGYILGGEFSAKMVKVGQLKYALAATQLDVAIGASTSRTPCSPRQKYAISYLSDGG